MSYVRHILQPDEKLIILGKLHWITFAPASFAFIVASALLALHRWYAWDALLLAPIALIYGYSLVSFLHAWFIRWITEFAVTDRRVIYKRGFINRHTAEMNMDKIESVDVDQSILGRILDFGTIHVLGTGQGIEHLHRIASPIRLRNAITAR